MSGKIICLYHFGEYIPNNDSIIWDEIEYKEFFDKKEYEEWKDAMSKYLEEFDRFRILFSGFIGETFINEF